jgi:hypothetical protein
MKNQHSSDINSMVSSSVEHAAVRLAMPACTALIWGLDAFAGADSAIWGTLTAGAASKEQAASRKQDFSAIWGTSGMWPPVQPPALSRRSSLLPPATIN